MTKKPTSYFRPDGLIDTMVFWLDNDPTKIPDMLSYELMHRELQMSAVYMILQNIWKMQQPSRFNNLEASTHLDMKDFSFERAGLSDYDEFRWFSYAGNAGTGSTWSRTTRYASHNIANNVPLSNWMKNLETYKWLVKYFKALKDATNDDNYTVGEMFMVSYAPYGLNWIDPMPEYPIRLHRSEPDLVKGWRIVYNRNYGLNVQL